MEARVNNHRRRQEVSPERAKVWTEKSPMFQQKNRKVAVVYYLSKTRQLDHPHFIQVPLSSHRHGLYLRDVIERLNVLRGRGIASMYSWSCKRSYKNGFVWHDLSEDDLILPVHGNEYILKGSELLDQSNSVGNVQVHNLKQLLKPPSSRCQDDSLSASSVKESKNSQGDELSQRPGSNADGSNGPLSLVEYKVCKTNELADASTQTEEDFSRPNSRETCTRGVSTDDSSFGYECNGDHQISEDSVSALLSSSNSRSSGAKTETLGSLIRADANRVNSFGIFEEEIRMPANARLKPSNMLMQLISCGSVSVKNHNFGHIPVYRPSFSHTKSTSPYFPSSLMFEVLDCLPEKPRLTGSRLEDKEYFSGSLVETKMLKDQDEQNTLKRSSSYNADRTYKQLDSTKDNDKSTTGHSKCIPSLIRDSISKQPRSESLRSPVSDKPRDSSDGVDGFKIIKSSSSNGSGKRITEPFSGEKQWKKLGSFGEEKEKIIKIEERIASGARIIIQSKAPYEAAIFSS